MRVGLRWRWGDLGKKFWERRQRREDEDRKE